MKHSVKLFFLLCISLLVLTALPAMADGPDLFLGDLNQNDRLDSNDCIQLRTLYLNNTDEITSAQTTLADKNQNGKIDSNDYILLRLAILCDDIYPPHVCTYGDWKSDGTNHWKECTCGNITAQATHQNQTSAIQYPTLYQAGHTAETACTVCQRVQSAGAVLPAIRESSGDHGYNSLVSHANGAAMQQFYLSLQERCLQYMQNGENAFYEDDIAWALKANYARYGINHQEAFLTLRCMQFDSPIFYWIENRAAADGTYLYIETDPTLMTGASRASLNQIIYRTLAETYDPTGSRYDRALRIHDMVIDHMDYAYESDGMTPRSENWAYNILGYFIYGEGVCECYAEVAQLFFNYWGIPNVYVRGTANGGGHAWNLAQMDNGQWYWFDLTWDDQPSWPNGRIYWYFCKTDAEFALYERTLETEYYTYPIRGTTSYPEPRAAIAA